MENDKAVEIGLKLLHTVLRLCYDPHLNEQLFLGCPI